MPVWKDTMNKKHLAYILSFCLCVSLIIIAKSVYSRLDYKADKLRKKIQVEIDHLGKHEWAGEYYFGDGFGVNVSLLIAPDSGCLFEWHGCLGLYDRNYGKVILKGEKIHLSLALKNERKGFQGIAEEFFIVCWGDRRYLIPPDEMIAFCNQVNSMIEPREQPHGSHLLRLAAEKNETVGYPQVPDEYKKYLLKKPIDAEIISVEKSITRKVCECEGRDIVVTLDIGKDSGLLIGMELYVTEPKNLVESVIITDVDDETSKAIMQQIFADDPGPERGWKVCTIPSWVLAFDENNQESSETGKPVR